LVDDYEDRLAQAEIAREKAEVRRRVAQESWEQVKRYLSLIESRAKYARIAFTRISEGSPSPLVLLFISALEERIHLLKSWHHPFLLDSILGGRGVLDYAFVDSMKVFSVKRVVWESHVGFECDRKFYLC
jgi:uncharacterized small protein (DUF1192 family)